MMMTLHEMPVGSIEVLRTEWQRPTFSLHELWRAAADGELEEFEQTLAGKASSAKGRALCEEILRCLAAMGTKQPPACPLLQNGAVTAAALASALAPYDPLAAVLPQSCVTAHGTAVLQQLAADGLCGGQARGWALYLFLLLHCQVKPQEAIRPQDVTVLRAILQKLPAAAAAAPAVRQTKLAIGRSGFLRCVGRQVQQRKAGSWVCLYEDETELAGLCCLEGDEVIVLRADGTLAPCTPQWVRAAAGQRRILQAGAWGGHCILLCDDGTAVSDLALPAWQQLHAVQLGANCAVGVRGAVHRGIQWNGAPQIDEFTDVRSISAHTYDGVRHYAVLRSGGALHWSGAAQPIPGVTAAVLCMQGVVYVQAGRLWLHPFGAGQPRLLRTLPDTLVIEELHCRDTFILCGTAEKPYAVQL